MLVMPMGRAVHGPGRYLPKLLCSHNDTTLIDLVSFVFSARE